MVTKKISRKTSKKLENKFASKKSTSTDKFFNNEVVCAVLQYFFPLGLLWYVLDVSMRKSSLVKFHLKQVLILVVIDIVLGIFLSISWFFWIVSWLFSLALGILWIIGLIAALQGEEQELPLIGKFASYFKF